MTFVQKNNNGFTLIEVIISVTILAFLSMYTAQTIQSGLQSKVKIQKQIDRDSRLRDALKVMADDIRQSFNYHDINIELFNNAQDERKKKASQKKTTPPPTTGTPPPSDPPPSTTTPPVTKEFKKKKEVILTQFIGTSEALHFTSTSHTRSVADTPYSNQAEIGYFLKTCRNRTIKENKSNCLWRRVSPIIDDKVEEDGTETVLLENVQKFELRYLGPQREEEWVDNWMTDVRGDAVTKSTFPYAVEITIEVFNKNLEKDKPLAMTLVAPLSFPNNLKKKNTDEKNNKSIKQ